MATTTNFGWETPDDTDLVKDGAAAIRTALGGVDTSFVDLKGGTTGQVLAKASNTDLDFVWSADASGIPATIFDAKGDIIAATAADTASRLAVGANNTVLTADSSTATGLKWATPASGGMTLLASGSLSGSSVSVTSISQDYLDLVVYVSNWNMTSNADLHLRINNVASGYSKVYQNYEQSTYTGSGGINQSAGHLSNYLQNSGQPGFTVVRIANYSSGGNGYRNCIYATSGVGDSGFAAVEHGNVGLTDSSSVTRVDLIASTGTFDSGTYAIYGVK